MIFLFIKLLLCNLFAVGYPEKGSLGPCPTLTNFPSDIPLEVTDFDSFSHEIKVPHAYKATPEFPEDVILICNWAVEHGYRVRALGNRHNWSPLLFALSEANFSCPKVILVDMKKHFTSMKINPSDEGNPELRSVTVGTGVLLIDLLTFLEKYNLGLFSSPSMGYLTIGGMLAIGGHGSGVRSATSDTIKSRGQTYGTLSNLIIEMTLVAWDKNVSSYVLKTLHRSDKDCKVFLVHLGRSFVTSVTLRVGKNQMFRAQSHLFITSKELFAPESNDKTRTAEKFLKKYGMINVIEIPFSGFCWVLTIQSESEKPPQSKVTTHTMNYNFMNNFPTFVEKGLKSLLFTLPAATKTLGRLMYPYLVGGSILSRSMDLWGPSKNLLLYMSPKILRTSDSSFVLVTSPENFQWVVSVVKSNYDDLLTEYAKSGGFPINGEFDIRITEIDDPMDVEVPGAEAPILSAASPLSEYPDYTIVIWVQISGLFGTPYMNEMLARYENKLYTDLHEKFAIVRPEWSKGWANTLEGPWKNETIMKRLYPRAFSSSNKLEEWNWAVNTLDFYDPHRIFSNAFLDSILFVHNEK